MRALQSVFAQQLSRPSTVRLFLRSYSAVRAQRFPTCATSLMPAVIEKPSVKAVAGLEPEALWRYFAELTQIPRPSKHEEKCVTSDEGTQLRLYQYQVHFICSTRARAPG